MRDIIWKIITFINCLLLIWIGFSWIEIILKNLTENPQYTPFNIFIFLLR